MAVNIAKLRDQARTYEARDQWREAIAAYRQILEAEKAGEPDIGLWNRVGDLHLKLNEQDKAVEAYEAAVNAYVDVGLYNNAIALCRKILRLVPGRANVYRRLGQISAAKGFFADARQNFLEYADRVRRAGQIDAAFEALREFADLSPDDAEIRRVLADQLLSHGHKDEAVEQLRILLGMLLARADEDAAEAVRQQIRAVDPTASTDPLARAEQASARDDFSSAYANLGDDEPAATGGAGSGITHGAAIEVSGLSLDDTGPALEGLETADYSREASPPPPAPPTAPPATPSRGGELELDAGFGDDLPLMDFSSGSALEDSAVTDEPSGYGEISLEPTSLSDEDEEEDAASDDYGGGLDLPLMDFGGDDEASAEPLPLVQPDEPAMGDLGYGTVDLGDTGQFGVVDLPGEEAVEEEEESASTDLPLVEGTDFGTVDLGGSTDTGFGTVDLPETGPGTIDLPAEPAPAPAVDRLDDLRARAAADPADHTTRDQLVDLLHERGQDSEVPQLLEDAHRTLADKGQWRDAIIPLSHLIRLKPGEDGPLLQKRVEYAFRSGDRSAMVEAYLALARHFDGQGNTDKARAVYGRVLEIEPANAEGKEAIAALDARTPAAPTPAGAKPQEAADYIDLGALILDDEVEQPGGTRFVVEEREPTGDEDKDFADMLAHFRQKVAENIEVEDSSSHYDLGLAFKEMGLLDEAIAEFQVALRGGSDPLATLEMLGACFADKGQYAVATRVLDRALRLPTTTDAELVGVLYQLGRSYESIGNKQQASEYYERVLSVDIRFRDTADRLEAMRAGR